MRILLRCDGGGALGVGHVMRSLALAEAAVDAGHEVMVAGRFEGSFLSGQLAAAPVEVVPLAASEADLDLLVFASGPQHLVDLVGRLRPDVLHVDSYTLSEVCFRDLVVSSMEDGTFGRRPADVVVDPTFGAEQSPRPDDGSTWLLRGSRYAPLRQRVLDARRGNLPVEQDAHTEVARKVLVLMGGTDPAGLAPAAVKLLADTGLALEVAVIAVGENAERVRAAAGGSRLSLNVLAPVDGLPAMMARQDLVISAAGTSIWELCCIGVPMAVVWAVDNQREGYDRVVAAGAALGLGGPEVSGPGLGEPGRGGDECAVGLLSTALTDSRVRADLVRAGRHVVDGLGAWRVVRTWEQAHRLGPSARSRSSKHELADRLTARRAVMDDALLLWEWRNDPGTRAGSRHGELVPWLEHLAWLESSLTRKDRVLLVVDDPLGPVGTVRWDLESESESKWESEREWEVSITVAPDRRGQSLARPMLRAAEVALLEVALPEVALPEVGLPEVARSRGTFVTAYLAVVHVDNRASVWLFETSGYVLDLPEDPRGFLRFRKAAPVT